MLYNPTAISPRLPNEPPLNTATSSAIFLLILRQYIVLSLVLALAPLWWLPYAPARLFWGRAPVVPALSQTLEYLIAPWKETPVPPLIFSMRLRLFLEFARMAVMAPLSGLAWYLDLFLYGNELKAVAITAPILEISAARSGSTQLSWYLEEDPEVVAPSFAQSLFPYLWFWRISPLWGRFITKEKIRNEMEAVGGPLFLERHESDPFRPDTLDVIFFTHHFNAFSRFLGPRLLSRDCSFGIVDEHNTNLMNRDFVDYVEGLGKKALLFSGTPHKQLMVKGHFIGAAEALEKRWPDARFITVCRETKERLRSEFNFLAVVPILLHAGLTPWEWLLEGILFTEIRYCEREMEWYQKRSPLRYAIRFEDYRDNLQVCLEKLYREVLGRSPPTIMHSKRKRHGYTIDRSLPQLGVDTVALDARLFAYEAWRKAIPPVADP